MDKKTDRLLSLCRDPILVVEKEKLAYMNPAARSAFPNVKPGKNALRLLPEFVLTEDEGRFTATKEVEGREYTILCDCEGGRKIIALFPRKQPEPSGLLSDGLITQLRSTLGTIGFAVSRATEQEERRSLDGISEVMPLLRLEYHSMKRQLDNLEMARLLREGQMWYEPMDTDLVELCADLADSVGVLTAGQRATIEFSSPLPKLNAYADALLLERLLLNLLSNSFAHTPQDGRISLRVEKNGGDAVITVEDNGSGIPMEIYQNVFSRYETRADRDHLDRASTAGLGLSIANGIARLHGGVLLVRTQEGKGTRVCLNFPLEAPAEAVFYRKSPEAHPSGLEPILTELAGILDESAYAVAFLD